MGRARGVRAEKASTRDMTRAVAYVRVSTEQQTLGPEAQRQTIQKWAEAQGITIVAFAEDRLSGASAPSDRPGMQEALQALAAHNAGVLLVAKRDRVARQAVHTMGVEFLLERQGCRLISVEDGALDPKDPMARLLATIRDVFAEMELLAIRSRVKAALAVKRGRGEVIGALPFGKCRAAEDPSKLADSEEEQGVIVLVHRLAERGLSLRRIARALDASPYKPRRGPRWHHHTVSRILGRAADSVVRHRSDTGRGHGERA